MNTKNPLVSIIIVNYNGWSNLNSQFVDCLRSILNTDYRPIEIIFVDNASSDSSVSVIENHFRNSKFKIIKSRLNVGYSGACNLGQEATDSQSKYIAFLNNDILATPTWLTELVSVMEEDPTIGVAGSRQLLERSCGTLLLDGAFLDHLGIMTPNWGDNFFLSKTVEVFTAGGPCMLVSRKFLQKSGGFDDKLFLLNEEVDLCWRAWISGYRVVSVRSSLIHHLGGLSINNMPNAKREYYGSRNRLKSIIKNSEGSKMVKYATLLSASYIFYALYLLVRDRKHRYALSYLNAVIWNVTTLPFTWKQRKKVQLGRKRSETDLIRRHVLLQTHIVRPNLPHYGV